MATQTLNSHMDVQLSAEYNRGSKQWKLGKITYTDQYCKKQIAGKIKMRYAFAISSLLVLKE